MRAAFDALGAWGAAAGMAEVTSNADESHVPEPYCFRAVFISDLHLGTPGCQATALLDFLKHHPSKTLYLVGDIVDGWQLRRRWFWPQAHNDVVQKLLRSARKGCRVVFVPGNHDEFARDGVRTGSKRQCLATSIACLPCLPVNSDSSHRLCFAV